MAIDQNLGNPNGVCFLCGMQAKGFVVQFNPIAHLQKVKGSPDINLRMREYPQFACCSLKCQNSVLELVKVLRGARELNVAQNTITQMEQKAIKEAKRGLYEALVAIGAEPGFRNQSAQNMEYLIYSVWCALRASMQEQSVAGEIPF